MANSSASPHAPARATRMACMLTNHCGPNSKRCQSQRDSDKFRAASLHRHALQARQILLHLLQDADLRVEFLETRGAMGE